MARRKPEDIIALVDAHHNQTEPMRQRMEDDYSIYRLAPYDAGEGYQSYTSNEPQTFADKVMGWIANAEMTVRIPHGGNDRKIREKNDLKERFLIGVLRAADERLCNMMLPPLKDQLAWYATLRGWYAGRVLHAKREAGTTYVASVEHVLGDRGRWPGVGLLQGREDQGSDPDTVPHQARRHERAR